MRKHQEHQKFMNSIEQDLNLHYVQLPFLNQYKIETLLYDSKKIRIYGLASDSEHCLLEAISKIEETDDEQIWETSKYIYRLIKQIEHL